MSQTVPYLVNTSDQTASRVAELADCDLPADTRQHYGTLAGCCLYGGVQATAFDREIGIDILTDGRRWFNDGSFVPEFIASRYRVIVQDGVFSHPPVQPVDRRHVIAPYSPQKALWGHLLRAWSMGCQNEPMEVVGAVEKALALDHGEDTLAQIGRIAEGLDERSRNTIDSMIAERRQPAPALSAPEASAGAEMCLS